MSLWELSACIDGYNRANSGEDSIEPMSAQQFDRVVAESEWITVH